MPMADNGLERRWTRAQARVRQGKLSSGTRAVGAAVQAQGANRGALLGLTAGQGKAIGSSGGGGGGG